MVKYKTNMEKALKHSEYPIVFPHREPGTGESPAGKAR